jgi:hypothetical protein
MDGVFLANVNFLMGLNSRFHQQLLLSGEYFANLTHGTHRVIAESQNSVSEVCCVFGPVHIRHVIEL